MRVFQYLLLIYTIYTFFVFHRMNSVTYTVIDEEFHIFQGQLYCHRDFGKWHSKITTPPGLYLWSFLFLGPLQICNGYALRMTNYIAGLINFVLFYVWHYIHDIRDEVELKRILISLNLAIFPPLWFFTNLYYTDVVGVMFLMLMFLFNKMEHHMAAANFGLLAMTVRQTNIIWVILLMVEYLTKQIYHACVKPYKRRFNIEEIDIKELKMEDLRNYPLLRNIKFTAWMSFYSYLMMVVVFFIFVYINDGIVMGDRSAHETVLHIPQIFYFSLFCLFFLWPHFIGRIVPFFKLIGTRPKSAMIVATLMGVIIYFNTMVHPYLLADNRHYTFYIWQRFYEGRFLFRYAMIPVYMFSLFSIVTKVYEKRNVTFALFFIPTTFLVLVLHKMIEVRYFLVPFLILRMRIRHAPTWALIFEFVQYMFINYKTVNIYLNKNITWVDYNYPQKLIW